MTRVIAIAFRSIVLVRRDGRLSKISNFEFDFKKISKFLDILSSRGRRFKSATKKTVGKLSETKTRKPTEVSAPSSTGRVLAKSFWFETFEGIKFFEKTPSSLCEDSLLKTLH